MARPLTTIERSLLAMAGRIVMNMVVLARCRGALDPERVERAIRIVQRRHELLRVRVVREGVPKFSTSDVPPIALRVIARRDADHWREVVCSELNEPLDIASGPLVRFVLIVEPEPEPDGGCELICTTDHVAADARSGLFVLRDVLRVLANQSLRPAPSGPRQSLSDPASQPRVSRWFRREPSGPARLSLPSRPAIDFVHRRIDRPRTESLVRACRARDVDVQSALSIASAQALASVRRPTLGRRSARNSSDPAGSRRNSSDPAGSRRIGCMSSVDLRSLLEPPRDPFGIFAWAPSSLHRLAPGREFWPLTARAQALANFHRSPIALAGYRWLIDLHTRFGAVLDRAASPLRGLCDGLLLVSDLGQIDIPRQVGEVEVESIGFLAMVPDVDFVLGAQIYAGQLELDFCYCPERIEPESMAEVADTVEAVLDAATQPSR